MSKDVLAKSQHKRDLYMLQERLDGLRGRDDRAAIKEMRSLTSSIEEIREALEGLGEIYPHPAPPLSSSSVDDLPTTPPLLPSPAGSSSPESIEKPAGYKLQNLFQRKRRDRNTLSG